MRSRLELQRRDLTLLRDLFVSRVMTLRHIAALHFDGHVEAAKKRVGRLKEAGYLRTRVRRWREPAIYVLAVQGWSALEARGCLTGYPRLSIKTMSGRSEVSDLTLRHELEVMDVKATLVVALRQDEQYRLGPFVTWPRICEFDACDPKGQTVRVKPDGYLEIEHRNDSGKRGRWRFFLELDRSTETLQLLTNRCFLYLDHYRSGGFAVGRGGVREEYKKFPFRVLIICKSAERRDHLAERLHLNRETTGSQIWLAKLSDLLFCALGAIWRLPKNKMARGDSTLSQRILLPEGPRTHLRN